MFKVNLKNTMFFIDNFEHISCTFLVFLLLTLNKWVIAELYSLMLQYVFKADNKLK